MRIENSPFHISKNKVTTVEKNTEPKSQKISDDNHVDRLGKDDFSFWDWFRGLINPFQNLPIISGIYSSINSEDSKSDRDLVQNSLGGFIYGGPIGAIAGFGNWIFNKIFDKTPSELALDITRISNFWKDEQSSETIVTEKNKIDDNKNSSELISKNNNYGEWWKGNQKSGIRQDVASSKKKIERITHANIKNTGVQNKDVSFIESNVNKYSKKPIVLENKDNMNLAFENKTELVKLNNQISRSLNNNNEDKNSVIEEFNEINFNYPNWSPDSLIVDKNTNTSKSKNTMNKKYLDLKNRNVGSNLNLKL